MEKELNRFRKKVQIDLNTGCWNWCGYIHKTGYGYTSNKSSGLRRAHRVSWYLHNGDFDRSLYVLHKCDNRRCVNPDHLYLGEQQNNVNDMIARGKIVNPVGSHHGRSKLTERQVIEIRKSGLTGREVSKKYKIGEANASFILNYKTWKHI